MKIYKKFKNEFDLEYYKITVWDNNRKRVFKFREQFDFWRAFEGGFFQVSLSEFGGCSKNQK